MIVEPPIKRIIIEYFDGTEDIFLRPLYYSVEKKFKLVSYDSITLESLFTGEWDITFMSLLKEEVISGEEKTT